MNTYVVIINVSERYDSNPPEIKKVQGKTPKAALISALGKEDFEYHRPMLTRRNAGVTEFVGEEVDGFIIAK